MDLVVSEAGGDGAGPPPSAAAAAGSVFQQLVHAALQDAAAGAHEVSFPTIKCPCFSRNWFFN